MEKKIIEDKKRFEHKIQALHEEFDNKNDAELKELEDELE